MPLPEPSSYKGKNDYIGACMSAQKSEDREQDQKLAICFSKWERNESNIVNRIDSIIGDETVTGAIATNTSGVGYPVQRKKRKKKDYAVTVKESIYGATLDSTGIAGSGQTRVVGDYNQDVLNLKKPVRFSKFTGTFIPLEEEDIDMKFEEFLNEKKEKFTIEVDVRDARKARNLLRDESIKHEEDGTNFYIFKKEDDFLAAEDAFRRAKIQIVPTGMWKNKKTGSRLYGPNIYKP